MGFFSRLFSRGSKKEAPRRELPQAGAYTGFIDHHSHILPGVDDGIRTVEQALEVLSIYETLGFSKIWLTPHVMEDFPNTTAALRSRFDELKAAYNGPIELKLASENMLDTLFIERLEANDFLPMEDRLLVETSYYDGPEDMIGILESVREKGYTPLLAHPERYRYMDMPDYRRLKDMGVEFQMNLFSLGGLYGPSAAEKAKVLLDAGFYNTSGTDIHHPRQASFLPPSSPFESRLSF